MEWSRLSYNIQYREQRGLQQSRSTPNNKTPLNPCLPASRTIVLFLPRPPICFWIFRYTRQTLFSADGFYHCLERVVFGMTTRLYGREYCPINHGISASLAKTIEEQSAMAFCCNPFISNWSPDPREYCRYSLSEQHNKFW